MHGYLGYLLGHASYAVYRHLEPQLRAAGLGSVPWRVLATLAEGPPLCITDLAYETMSKQPTLSKMLLRMRDDGWVTLIAPPEDQRRTLVALTPQGQRLAKRLLVTAAQLEAELLQAMGAKDAATLKALLRKLTLHTTAAVKPAAPSKPARAPAARRRTPRP